MPDKQVESAYQIDFREMKFPIIAVYQNPEDYPGMYVARVWEVDRPTNVVIVKKDSDGLQQDIATHTGMAWLPRSPKDHKVLVGTWIKEAQWNG